MPKLPETVQETLPLYPVVNNLDSVKGVIIANIDDLPTINPQQRITLGRLASMLGQNLGPTEGVSDEYDPLLEVTDNDFANCAPSTLERGLYIPRFDPRYTQKSTEQLVRPGQYSDRSEYGVVFPSTEFTTVARSARDLAVHTMAKTRKANRASIDIVDKDNTTGRSVAHMLGRYIRGLNSLEDELIEKRESLLIPLYRETYSPWQAHFKARNLDKKRKQFDEHLHDTIETATLNLDIGSTAIKAVHRAAASNLYRRGSSREINAQWKRYIEFVGKYVAERRKKIAQSKERCQEQYEHFEPFLATKPAQV